MPSFSVSSLLNQTPAECAVDQRRPLPCSRPAVLDICNLLCSSTALISKEAGEPSAKPLLGSPTTPSPLNSAGGFQLPPISHAWSAGVHQQHHQHHPHYTHHHLPLLPSIPKTHESNSIWMHDSMASSVSSVASNTTLSSCGSIEPITTATSSAPSPLPATATVVSAGIARALPLKKQLDPPASAGKTSTMATCSAGTKRGFYDDDNDLESMCGDLISSDEEQASSPPAIKAKRRRANAKQLEVLNRVFDRTVFPSTQLRAELGRQLGMTPRTVQIWFQNRRQAIRTRERQRLLRIVRDDHPPESRSC